MLANNKEGAALSQVIVAKVVIKDTVSLKWFLRALARSKVSQHLVKKTSVVFRNGVIRITLTVAPESKKTLELTFKRGVLKQWEGNLKTTTVTCKIPDIGRLSRP